MCIYIVLLISLLCQPFTMTINFLCPTIIIITRVNVNTTKGRHMFHLRIKENLKLVTRQVPLVEQELLTLPEHLSSPPFFSGVCVTRSLVLCVCFVDNCLSCCPFSFGHCVVCPSIYGF